MELTIFLAQIWGPVLVAVAIGIFTSHAYYRRLYRDLEKSPLALLTFGMVAMAAGLAQVLVHNEWEAFATTVVTLLGWGLLLKGALFIAAPGFVDRAGNGWARRKLVPVAATLTLLVGVYLTWFAYFV